MTKRIEWIDICKGLGIFLVVIGHTGMSKISQTMYDWIYSFHMPFFYMLSGLVFNELKYDTLGKYIKRRLKTLVIPFFILNTILFCIAKVLNLNNIQPPQYELITGVLAMYFLRILFVSEVVYYFINKIFKIVLTRIISMICLICLSYYISENYDLGFVQYFMPGMPLLYYGLGHILKLYIKQYIEVFSIMDILIIVCLSISFSFIMIIEDINILFMNFVLAISGITSLLAIGVLLSRIKYSKLKNVICYIGMNTLVIVAFHQIIYNGLTLITRRIHLLVIADSCIRFILVWIFLFILCRLFNKFVPIAIGK